MRAPLPSTLRVWRSREWQPPCRCALTPRVLAPSVPDMSNVWERLHPATDSVSGLGFGRAKLDKKSLERQGRGLVPTS